MKIGKKLSQIIPSITRHFIAKNSRPYERILKDIRARGDIWITSQGDYISWWVDRGNSALRVRVVDGACQVWTSLENAVIERWPGEFLDSFSTPGPETDFSGQVWITIDSALEKRELLIEILKREGILNFRVGDEGDFLLSKAELDPLLAEIEPSVNKRRGKFWEADVSKVRQIVMDKLAQHNLPLLRIWYHPRVSGRVVRAVFSPRYDVDRAISNIAQIRALEQKYDVSSTLYIRAFCPFYTDQAVRELATSPWCSEIVLHGEFVTYARRYGDEFKAAQAEKRHLEEVTGRPILGVGMHGGELTNNRSQHTDEAIHQAGFLYDSTPRPARDFLPSRKVIEGRFSESYTLSHALGDIEIPADRNYQQVFYDRVMAKMDEIYQQHGVFVLMLHPVYFGFFSYLFRPRNWSPLVRFSLSYFRKSLQFSSQFPGQNV